MPGGPSELLKYARDQHNRRHSYRVGVVGVHARCRGQHSIAEYAVVNVSNGGLWLAGPEIELGEQVRIDLQCPGHEPISVEAPVVRSGGEHDPHMGVCFCDLSPAAEDLIQDLLLAGLLLEREPMAVILEQTPESHVELAHDIEVLGRRAVCVSTPLEAIVQLDDPSQPVDTVFVETSPRGVAFAHFLNEEYPCVRRILMKADRAAGTARTRENELFDSELSSSWSTGGLRGALDAYRASVHP